MPFKFGLRKARRYNVSSRNAYVVCVNMLDNNLIECTLTADGTGHDCLQNIAQRIHLNEIYYFGLQYVNKKLQFRWLDLDRPLKKQLDKCAHSPLLYFRVMFYVADAQTIRDEITRYQYYLQLKINVIDGKLPCTQKQAVLLGAYSLQAEFSDHDATEHSVDNLHKCILLPRNMCTEERITIRLMQEMLELHLNLRGVSQELAELQYIIETQQLEGYGLDYYPAKDTAGQELLLGASFIGIFVKYLNGQPANYFKWSDINNLTHTKRNFNIETSLSEKTVHFQMDDPDMVKYVFKMCSLQHKFYHTKQHTAPVTITKPHGPQGKEDSNANSVGSIGPLPDIQQTVQMYDAEIQEQPEVMTTEEIAVEDDIAYMPTENHYENSQTVFEQEQVCHPSMEEAIIHDQTAVYVEQPPQQPATSQQPAPPQQQQDVWPTRIPSYRPAPDYETIMRQRMEFMAGQQQHQRSFNLPNIARAQVYCQPELLAYSQPEISHLHQSGMLVLPHNHFPHHVNSNGRAHVYSPMTVAGDGITVDRTHSLIIQPTYSTPELYQISTAPHRPEHHLSPIMYKLPPPYPRSSNSYPDLASMQAAPNRESPDLVSRKNLTNAGLIVQSQLDQSIENLALAGDVQQHRQPLTPAIAFSKPQICDERPQAEFCYEVNSPQPQHQQQQREEQEVFITDPPCPNPPHQSQFMVSSASVSHNPLGHRHSLPLQSYDQYGAENPYENLPAAYENQEMQPVKTADNEIIDCLDMTTLSDSIDSHHTSDSVIVQDSPQPQHSRSISSSSTQDGISTMETSVTKVMPNVGPLKMAALNGLSISRGSVLEISANETNAPRDERCKDFEMKLEEGQVFVEFEQILKKRTGCECSVGGDNNKRNRFRDIIPYDDTRVVLTQSKGNLSGYINASHIKMKVKKQELRYISTQGPLPSTVSEFWQLVWEQNIQAVAMLTGLEEAGRDKCHRYWPENKGPKNKQKYGDYDVYVKLIQGSGSYVTRTLAVTHRRSGKQRQIWHLQYTGWPDHGCPGDTEGFHWYLEEIESVRRQCEMELGPDEAPPPLLVHCSAGVGRSGVLILTHIMRVCLDHSYNVNVASVLEKMRAQRMHMVQTVTQYTFVYQCLVNYLKGARLI